VVLHDQNMRSGRSQAGQPLHHNELVLVKGSHGHSPDTNRLEDPHLIVARAQGVPFVRALVVDGVFFRHLYVYVVVVEERVDGCLEVGDAVM